MNNVNLRAKVVQTLIKVQEGKSLASILHYELEKIAPQDKSLFHELVLGTLRQWFSLKAITLPLLEKPLNNIVVETCLYVGLYQTLFTRIAEHAAISETVTATKQLGYEALSGVVNAILRKSLRDKEKFQIELSQTHGLPSWLSKKIKKDWPEYYAELCQELKKTAPLTLRINQRKISQADYLKLLHQENIKAEVTSVSKVGIHIQESVNIKELPGYDLGWFSVQDEHAQICGELSLELNNKTVIDACAAPGGKTSHLLEKYSPKFLTALDQDELRLQRVTENLKRLDLLTDHVEVLCADAAQWQPKEKVDCIILDAPCSATGVIRRHPDIRLLRKSEDITKIIELQKNILNHLWMQLKENGILVYITCSILKDENSKQINDFFAKNKDAIEVSHQNTKAIPQTYGMQFIPLNSTSGDGFYYCIIKKES